MSLLACGRSRGQSSAILIPLSLARVGDLGSAVWSGIPLVRRACQSWRLTVEWSVCCGADLAGRAMATKKKKARKSRKPGAGRPAARESARLTAGECFEKLAAVQARLRAPD